MGKCGICHKGIGVKLNCCWKKCQERFHAKCAIEAGQDMLIAENEDKTSIYLLVGILMLDLQSSFFLIGWFRHFVIDIRKRLMHRTNEYE